VDVSNDRRDLRGMSISDFIQPENKPGTELVVQFWPTTRGEWHYDAESGKYLRWIEEITGDNQINMIPLVDRLNNEQLAFSNIVILYATYIEYAPTLHDIRLFDNDNRQKSHFLPRWCYDRRILEDHQQWRPILLLNSWGLPMHLKPGNTWIVLNW
jgi:hypothetical protein